ncbi:unnamed protein product [Darwinula stevensoni]|uniref:Syntaxin-18 n=1 Tax=Darwinula stevensoni TaxID=69355 RepID=A0A7R8XHX1_9CRUS|nr:unnamed protein product [Darwinula stevensoni]CAG0893850.1 unnamed protein product [Darwinula stevensoni]
MDLMPAFAACVKAIRNRNQVLGLSMPDMDPKRILGQRTRPRCDLTSKAKLLVGDISQLRDFLQENHVAYLNNASHFGYNASGMTDADRDHIDTGAQTVMRSCRQLLLNLRKEAGLVQGNAQTKQHWQAVADIIEAYLKSVCKVYSTQRAVRVKRMVERQKLERLEIGTRRGPKLERLEIGTRKSSEGSRPIITDMSDEDLDTEELTPEDLRILEQENRQIFQELNSLVDEVKQIEGKVVRIAELQEIFTEKVLDQEKDIEKLSHTVVGTTENVKFGNEQVREAIKKNAGFRVWILFFLLVMSFSLLFLDWYND